MNKRCRNILLGLFICGVLLMPGGLRTSYANEEVHVVEVSEDGVAVPVVLANESAILGFTVDDLTQEGFRVTCNVTSEVASAKVTIWTLYKGQDDKKVYTGTKSGNTFSCYVPVKNHRYESGMYTGTIQVFNSAQKELTSTSFELNVYREAPDVYDLEIIEKTTLGYTVKGKIKHPEAVNRIQFPTWTELNGQDDLVTGWPTNNSIKGTIKGDIVTFRVNDSAHNYEKGLYNTHVYTFDNTENRTRHDLTIDLQNDFVPAKRATYFNSEYLLFNDNLSWHDAKIKCERLGGHLVTINSQEEQNVIDELIQGKQRANFYIGGFKENNKFRWVTNEPFIYQNWRVGEPNNQNGVEGWLELFGFEGWNDRIATMNYNGFICEIPLIPATGITLNQASVQLRPFQMLQLIPTITPANASNKNVRWISANESVALVDSNGMVIAMSSGMSLIVAVTESGQHMAYCSVTVGENARSVSNVNKLKQINERITMQDLEDIAVNNHVPEWLAEIMK